MSNNHIQLLQNLITSGHPLCFPKIFDCRKIPVDSRNSILDIFENVYELIESEDEVFFCDSSLRKKKFFVFFLRNDTMMDPVTDWRKKMIELEILTSHFTPLFSFLFFSMIFLG